MNGKFDGSDQHAIDPEASIAQPNAAPTASQRGPPEIAWAATASPLSPGPVSVTVPHAASRITNVRTGENYHESTPRAESIAARPTTIPLPT